MGRTVASGCDLVPDGAERSQSIPPQTLEVRSTTVLCSCRSFLGGFLPATARPVAGLLEFCPQAVLRVDHEASKRYEGPSSIHTPRSSALWAMEEFEPVTLTYQSCIMPRPSIYSKSFFEVVGSSPEPFGVSPLAVASTQ